MSDIFISYSHKDSDYAHDLAAKLIGKGFTVFVDNQINYGDQWSQVLQRELDNCTAFLLIMTPRADASKWVHNELNRATKKKKAIFPILLEGEEWLPVQSLQYVDVRNGKLPPKKFYKQLNKAIPEKGHLTPQPIPALSDPNPIATPTVSGSLSGISATRSPDWWKESEKRLKEAEERRQEARENSPPFYATPGFWISTVLNLAACIGIALLIVPLVERVLNWSLGLLSLSAGDSQLDQAVLAVALSGLAWAVVYTIVAAMFYYEDPEQGQRIFFLRGLLGGWMLWLEDLEDGAGRAGSFPLNMLVIWALARVAAWAALFFLGWNPATVAYVSLGLLTVISGAYYLILSTDYMY